MALREFLAPDGARWRVWDIAPESLHPALRTSPHLQGFTDGWLVFEREDGGEKRRLYPVPARWTQEDDHELCRLWLNATPTRSGPVDSGERADAPGPAPAGSTPSGLRRTFLYPGGRLWTVCEWPVQRRDDFGNPLGGTSLVLRFASGGRWLDLQVWPPQWARLSESELADLLWRGFPREDRAPAPDVPHRRRGDRRASPRGE